MLRKQRYSKNYGEPGIAFNTAVFYFNLRGLTAPKNFVKDTLKMLDDDNVEAIEAYESLLKRAGER